MSVSTSHLGVRIAVVVFGSDNNPKLHPGYVETQKYLPAAAYW
ncbi:MAG: hypothetical protein WB919_11345 [Candidatus Sulfotelmatobacter sp.]